MALQRWSIDPARSQVGFTVRHLMFAKVRGRFARLSGTVAHDEANPAASSVEVELEAASVDTGDRDRDENLRAEIFDVQRFPKLTFKSTRVEKRGARLRLAGTLTIRTVSREVVLDVEPRGAGRFRARGALNRKDYGLQWSAALETGGMLVGDEVTLELEVQAQPSTL
jgi:polyisoprenoid-binding protein YceI